MNNPVSEEPTGNHIEGTGLDDRVSLQQRWAAAGRRFGKVRQAIRDMLDRFRHCEVW